jgi:cytochrome c-type biogenesis protein CcmE
MGSKRIKFLVGGLVVVAAIVALAFFAVRGNAVYYYTVTELQQKGPAPNVRVAGDLVSGTLVKKGVGEPIEFEIYDKGAPDNAIFVTYTGAVPDTFKDDPDVPVEVVVEGDYLSDGTFNADFLLAKCPSKYEKKAEEKAEETSATGQ